MSVVYPINPDEQVLAFWVGPFHFAVDLASVYQVVPGEQVMRADRHLLRYKNMPIFDLNLLLPVRSQGKVCVIVWHEDAIGGIWVDRIPSLVRAPVQNRYPIPPSWLRPGHAWIRSVALEEGQRYPIFILNVPAMMQSLQERLSHAAS